MLGPRPSALRGHISVLEPGSCGVALRSPFSTFPSFLPAGIIKCWPPPVDVCGSVMATEPGRRAGCQPPPSKRPRLARLLPGLPADLAPQLLPSCSPPGNPHQARRCGPPPAVPRWSLRRLLRRQLALMPLPLGILAPALQSASCCRALEPSKVPHAG